MKQFSLHLGKTLFLVVSFLFILSCSSLRQKINNHRALPILNLKDTFKDEKGVSHSVTEIKIPRNWICKEHKSVSVFGDNLSNKVRVSSHENKKKADDIEYNFFGVGTYEIKKTINIPKKYRNEKTPQLKELTGPPYRFLGAKKGIEIKPGWTRLNYGVITSQPLLSSKMTTFFIDAMMVIEVRTISDIHGPLGSISFYKCSKENL